jgi:hypothetical protein
MTTIVERHPLGNPVEKPEDGWKEAEGLKRPIETPNVRRMPTRSPNPITDPITEGWLRVEGS